MAVSDAGLIAIWVSLGVVVLALVCCVVYWLMCHRRRSSSACCCCDANSSVVVVAEAAVPPQHRQAKRAAGVPLHVVSSPAEGTYVAPLIVELNTLQPGLEILVRIVAVTREMDADGTVLAHPSDTSRDVAGLMLYRDPLEFVEPGTYYVLAHTLSPDKSMSEVQQFVFVVHGKDHPSSPAAHSGILPPVISPSHGEITQKTYVSISHPLVVPLDVSPLHQHRIDGKSSDAAIAAALVAQGDVSIWYSLDGSFPSIRYYAPFLIPLLPHTSQRQVTIRALSTSSSRCAASDVVEAQLTVVSDTHNFFDPSIAAPSLVLQASGSLLYFEDPRPKEIVSCSSSGAAAGYTPKYVSSSPPLLDATSAPATSVRYDVVNGSSWCVMFCLEYVDAARHSESHRAVGGQQPRGVASSSSTHWLEYTRPVQLSKDVARIAAYTLVSTTTHGSSTMRSKVVLYDVARHWSTSNEALHENVESFAAAAGDDGEVHKSKKKSSKGKRSKGEKRSSKRHADGGEPSAFLHSADGDPSGAAHLFPPPVFSGAVEASDVPSPVMCVTCQDVDVKFDDPPRGCVILYTLNSTDPCAELGEGSSDAPRQVFEWRGGGAAPIRLVRGEYETHVTLTARTVVPMSSHGESGVRFGHRFSRRFYFQ